MSAVEQMISELQRRNYSPKTIAEYVKSIRRLAAYFGCCPSKLTLKQVRDYQLHLARRDRISWSYYNHTVSAIRFLYREALRRDWPTEELPYARRGRRLPVVLSRQEVFRLWRPLYHPKRRLLLMTAYAGALRLSELVHLRVEDLDAERMLIRIRQGKGRRDRFVPYSPTLKQHLDGYLAEHHSPWLFCGQSPERLLSPWSDRDICSHAAHLAKLQKRVTIYTLRHSAATHLMEMGVDLRTIQKVLGHDRLSSTMRYTHLSYDHLQRQIQPLDLLPQQESPPNDTSPPADD